MNKIFFLSMTCGYNYGGDTGPGTLFNKYIGPVDYPELLAQIDAFTEELKQSIKHMENA